MNEKRFDLFSHWIAKFFIYLFLSLSIAMILALFNTVIKGIINGTDIIQIYLYSINSGIIALAVFELALVINKEYTEHEDSKDPIAALRRTLPRFVGTVCVALSLEGLIMIIKYSQLDMAGNLYYPVAIISCTALLIAALGVFIRLTKDHKKEV
jgi:hypothetical protein